VIVVGKGLARQSPILRGRSAGCDGNVTVIDRSVTEPSSPEWVGFGGKQGANGRTIAASGGVEADSCDPSVSRTDS
jgi:hypothetical protein